MVALLMSFNLLRRESLVYVVHLPDVSAIGLAIAWFDS
jgi:hypothetical protein